MIKLNCLAGDLDNALEIDKITGGNALIGILSKSFDTDEAFVEFASEWSEKLNGNISIGLGGGDPKQAYMVTRLVGKVKANHANQVFTEVPATRNESLNMNKDIIINSLISPSGIPGKVIISTGPDSTSNDDKAIVSADVACQMIKEMGGSSVKYFNMKNMKSDEEFVAVAKGCAKYGLIMEMTGGLGLENIEKYIKISKDEGIKEVIPHVYGSIMNKKTGMTNLEDVKKLWDIFKRYY